MATTKGKKQKKKVRLKKGPIIFLGLVIIATITILAILLKDDKPQEQQIGINIQGIGGQPQSIEQESRTVATMIDINMEDCCVPIGTVMLATAGVTPQDTDNALNWSSSDENVFTVTSDGVVTAKNIGTAALTATIGNVSDAIVIEVVAATGGKSQYNLPMYDGSEDATEASNEQETTQSTVQVQVPTIAPTAAPIASTAAVTSRGIKSTDLNALLPNMGYSQRMSNVYIYGESDTNYQGEIIIQSNCTIIYVKDRTSDYDSAIQQVISQLLPDEYSQVWNNYISASSDRTFTSEGRTVRIVTAQKGGHSQIVIYN